MADKRSSVTPIEHRGFKGAIDADFFDIADNSIEYVAKSTNLTPFRKTGSLVQCPGVTSTSYPTLPTPAGYNCINMHIFSIDRDNKEVTILVFENASGLIKLYVTPYWNPATTFSNNNPNKTAESWINEWLELTEQHSGTIGSLLSVVPVPNLTSFEFSTETQLSATPDYFNGWFVINTSASYSNENKFNYITDYTPTDNRFTVKADILPTDPTKNWIAGSTVYFFRFPVMYFHSATVPGKGENYVNANSFKAKPTQFDAFQNQLRMPCGKELRPIVLDMIYKRTYLSGDNQMTYDGFWLDFQQPMQVLKDSAISAFGALLAGGTTAHVYIDPTIASLFVTLAPGSGNYVRLTYKGSGSETIIIKSNASSIVPFTYAFEAGSHQIRIGNTSPTMAAFKLFYDEFLSSMFDISVFGSASFTRTDYDDLANFIYGATGGYGADAGANNLAHNLFLGAYAFTANATADDKRTPFILTLTLDNRNEVILAHGNMRSMPADATKDLQLRFNMWFSRKITHFSLYNGDEQSTTGITVPTVFRLGKYPYFAWIKGARINELPLKGQMPFDNVSKGINGELPEAILNATNPATGINAFTLGELYWYMRFNKDNNGIHEKGKGNKFIVNTNRFIDQDTTLNYTHSCFIPQTNGRFFIIGVKNTTVDPVYENDDAVHFNTYAVGISAYDVFTLDRFVNVASGDRDSNKAIFNFKGYILVFKEFNYYILDVKTPNEVQYRVVDTLTGRGTVDFNAMCQTSFGIIMPSKDKIWLVTESGITPILTEFNGRLSLYRNTFAGQQMSTVFYNEFNEVMIYKTNDEDSLTHPSYVLVYNFEHRFWTDYEMAKGNAVGVRILKAVTNSSQQVILLNYKDITHYNLVRVSELHDTFIDTSGSTFDINWEFETHEYPYTRYLVDSNAEWITFLFSLNTSALRKLLITETRNPATSTTNDVNVYTLDTLNTSNVLKTGRLFDISLKETGLFQTVKYNITNIISSTVHKYKYFSIDNFILWASSQARQRENKAS